MIGRTGPLKILPVTNHLVDRNEGPPTQNGACDHGTRSNLLQNCIIGTRSQQGRLNQQAKSFRNRANKSRSRIHHLKHAHGIEPDVLPAVGHLAAHPHSQNGFGIAVYALGETEILEFPVKGLCNLAFRDQFIEHRKRHNDNRRTGCQKSDHRMNQIKQQQIGGNPRQIKKRRYSRR